MLLLVYIIQVSLLVCAYIEIATTHVFAMISEFNDHLINYENIETLEELYSSAKIKLFKEEMPNKIFYLSTLAHFCGSDVFFNDLALLESYRENGNFDNVLIKKAMLEQRFSHPAILIYYPEFDSFSLNFLMPVKNINNMSEVATIPLSNIDLSNNFRPQYISTEFIQIPRNMFVDFIKNKQLTVVFGYKNVDISNYFIEQNISSELQLLARENYKILQTSKEFISGGYFEITSSRLSKAPLIVSKIDETELITVKYMQKNDSFLISRAIIPNKQLGTEEVIKEILKKPGKQTCRCIFF
jgi:hypothetical protein